MVAEALVLGALVALGALALGVWEWLSPSRPRPSARRAARGSAHPSNWRRSLMRPFMRPKHPPPEQSDHRPSYAEMTQRLRSSPGALRAYEALVSNIHLLNSTPRLKTILVTSAKPEEGKTTVTVNLAATLTMGGKKVMVVDADVRRPRIHEVFGLPNARGFTDLIAAKPGFYDISEIGHVIDSSLDTPDACPPLTVITSGRIAASALTALDSPQLREAIEYLVSAYDIVLLDSPPVLSVSDASLMAPLLDGALLVVNTGVVTREDTGLAKDRLEQAGGRLLGVVMNRFDETLHGPGFHPYQDYYIR